MADVNVDILIRAKDLATKAFQQVEKSGDTASKKLADGFKNAGKSIEQFGKSISLVSAAFAATGGLAVKRAGDLEQVLVDVSTLIDDNVEESMKTLETGMKKMLQTMPKTVDDLGVSLYNILSSEIDDVSVALDVLESSAKLAVAGIGTTEQATALLIGSISAFKLNAEDSSNTADILFKTIKNGLTTVAKLHTNFGQVSGQALAAKISFEELMASIAAMTSITGKTAQAETELAALFREVGEVGGPLDQSLQKLGSSTGDLQKMIESVGLVPALESLRDSLGLTDEQMKNLFGSSEAGFAAFLLLTQANETYKNSLEDMSNGANKIDIAFAKQMKTFNNLYRIMKNKINVGLYELGNAIIPILIPVMEKLGNSIVKIAEWFEKLNPTTQKIVLGLGALVIAAGPAIVIIGKLVGSVGSLIEHGPLIVSTLKGIKIALGAMGIGGGPVIWIIGAIAGALILLTTAWIQNWGGIQEKTKKVWADLKVIFGFIKEEISGPLAKVWETVKTAWTAATVGVATILSELGASISAWVETLKKIWENPVVEVLTAPFRVFTDAAKIAIEKSGVGEALETTVKYWSDIMKIGADKQKQTVEDGEKEKTKAYEKGGDEQVEVVKKTMERINQEIEQAFTNIPTTNIEDFMNKIAKLFAQISSDETLNVKDQKAAYQKLLDGLQNFYANAGDAAQDWSSSQKMAFENLVKSIDTESDKLEDSLTQAQEFIDSLTLDEEPVQDAFMELGQVASDSFEIGTQDMLDYSEEIPYSIADNIQGNSSVIEKAVEATSRVLEETATLSFDSAMDSTSRVLESGMQKATEAMRETMNDELEKARVDFDSEMGRLQESFDKTMSQIEAQRDRVSGYTGGVSGVRETMSEIQSLISRARSESETLSREAPTLRVTAAVGTDEYNEQLSEANKKLQEFQAENAIASDSLDDIRERLDMALASGRAMAEGLLRDTAGTPVEQLVKDLLEQINLYSDTANESFQSSGLEADRYGNELWLIGERAGDAFDAVQEGLATMDKDLTTKADNAKQHFEDMKDSTKEAFDDTTEHIKTKFEDMEKALEDGAISIGDAFEKLGMRIENSVGKAFANVTGSGEVSGAVSGTGTIAASTGDEGRILNNILAARAAGSIVGLGWPELNYLRDKGIDIAKFGMSSGGIVTKPTTALIGESGPEAVIPLSRGGFGDMLKQLSLYSDAANKSFQSSELAGNTINYNVTWQTMTTPSIQQRREVVRDLYDMFAEETRRRNATRFNI